MNNPDRIFTYNSPHGKIDICYSIEGSGPPLLLLHGFPQTKRIWDQVVSSLTNSFTVIRADLRGYGKSSKPIGLEDHQNYSKREMARDMRSLMQSLGFEEFYLAGHDRGGRVAHRLTTDYPDQVLKLMVLDISPTWRMYQNTTKEFATLYWHWFFLVQPFPIPETLIKNNVDFLLPRMMGAKAGIQNPFSQEAFAEYVSIMSHEDALHAMCEDYRASRTIDLVHDQEFRDLGIKLNVPLCVLWGEKGVIHRCFHPIEDWSELFSNVEGHTVPSGHYIPEEVPELLGQKMLQFFQE